MTMLKPTLQLLKLQVLNGPQIVYAGDFHSGVNIISGQNASGKSTLMDFIFYVLGGDGVPWKNEALLCSDVVAQVAINGEALTLERTVNDKQRNPMYVFWGDLDSALRAPFSAWQLYPYQRSSKESFSQVLFRLLGLPELRGEGAANITMHQLLRLMYVDQRTPHDQIFRFEPFDTMLTRETVGNYLCGVYSDKLYDAQIELKDVEAKLEKSISDLRNLFQVLGKTGVASSTSDFLRAEAASINEEIARLEQEIAAARKDQRTSTRFVGVAEKRVAGLRDELTQVQRSYIKKKDEVVELQLENKDSELFIFELERRLHALDDSQDTRKYLGNVKFNYCPCCLSKIEDVEGGSVCSLCKSPNQNENAGSQLLRLRNELALQRSESRRLFEARRERLLKLEAELPVLQQQLRALESRFKAAASEWISPGEAELEGRIQRLGQMRQKLSQIAEYQKLATVVEEMQSSRSILEARKGELQDLILRIKGSDEALKDEIYYLIMNTVVDLLRADLPRQEEFISAGVVDWDFGANWVSVNGQKQFSESSMVVLKHCFHFAMLVASAKNAEIRYPRFLMLDGIDDGGQEIERSHALQKLIVKVSEELEVDHQIIFATSQISPDLASSSLVIGKESSVQSKTLALP